MRKKDRLESIVVNIEIEPQVFAKNKYTAITYSSLSVHSMCGRTYSQAGNYRSCDWGGQGGC